VAEVGRRREQLGHADLVTSFDRLTIDDTKRAPGVWEREDLAAGGQVWRRVVAFPMRDGVTLVADLYAPDPDCGPGPVVLERTPYGRRALRSSDGALQGEDPASPSALSAYLVDAGFLVLRQDCRGRGDSQGTFVKYLNEGADGIDTVTWIAAQPWCDGRIATIGVSYSAHTQAALAALGPSHVAAMWLDSGGFASAYETGFRMGGAFELKQATWAYRQALLSPAAVDDPLVRAALTTEDLTEWFTALPWRRRTSPLRSAPEYEDYLITAWEHEDFDEYWRQPGLYARDSYDSFPDAPSMHISSWYDPYIRTAVENFAELSAKKDKPAYLVLGPWTHGARSVSYAGDIDFGPAATLDGNLDRDYHRFRRRWLTVALDLSDDRATMPRVQYFLMGGGSGARDDEGRLQHGGQWCTAPTWPPCGVSSMDLHLHADGQLQVAAPTVGQAYVEYDFDPRHPVPTIGGQVTSGEPVMVGGGFDQTPDDRTYGAQPPYLPLDSRADVLSFTTEPLEQDVLVAGQVTAHLYVASSAVDTDFTVKLVDCYPPSADYPRGFALNLVDGILRARYRVSIAEPEPLVPHQVCALEVELPDTANRFAARHRIRVDVSSSNFPRFDVNPNTGGSTAASRRQVVATNRLHLDATHPSRVVLPVLRQPPRALPAPLHTPPSGHGFEA